MTPTLEDYFTRRHTVGITPVAVLSGSELEKRAKTTMALNVNDQRPNRLVRIPSYSLTAEEYDKRFGCNPHTAADKIDLGTRHRVRTHAGEPDQITILG